MSGLALALALAAARLPPVDQCTGDPSFTRYRSDLARIVGWRDARGLLAMLSDEIMVDFENSSGPREFARVWQLRGPNARRSPVWRELRAVMQLGCARVDSARVMPSLVEQLADDEQFDKFVALPGAKLRQSPRTGARVLATLNFHTVTFRESRAPDNWLKVALSNGRQGYVRREDIRGALQYRAQFEKVRGRWRMVSFVEGD